MIDGFGIGHHTADGDGWLTGTTVVLARAAARSAGWTYAAAARAPGRPTCSNPTTLIERVARRGADRRQRVRAGGGRRGDGGGSGGGRHRLPGRTGAGPGGADRAGRGDLRPRPRRGVQQPPDGGVRRRALAAASAERPATGVVGAGTGAKCGGLKGGFGYAERRLDCRCLGRRGRGGQRRRSAGRTRSPAGCGRTARQRLATPTAGRAGRRWRRRTPTPRPPPLATTIGVVLTDATLTKAQASKVAAVGHDGMARAIRPVHSMLDGDTVFCLASGRIGASRGPFRGAGGLQPAAGRGRRRVHRSLPGRAPGRGGPRCPGGAIRELAPSASGLRFGVEVAPTFLHWRLHRGFDE